MGPVHRKHQTNVYQREKLIGSENCTFRTVCWLAANLQYLCISSAEETLLYRVSLITYSVT